MNRRSIGLSLLLLAFVASGSQCPTTPSNTMPTTPTGDAANGKALFAANGCAACHCADASGGCALSAPALKGVSFQIVDDHLRGTADHPGGKFMLTDQEIADLQAYFVNPGT